ncbi:hypothetical protein B0H19DRAFT_1066904 [Mycena capillaripes]|nr:hypothetical protein B0H19DRAFT_1066904 [Mycena capillaripes]
MPGERYHPTMGIELLLARTMEKMVSNIQHQEWWAWGVERRWFCHAVDRGLCDDWGENGKKGEGVLTLSVLICGDKSVAKLVVGVMGWAGKRIGGKKGNHFSGNSAPLGLQRQKLARTKQLHQEKRKDVVGLCERWPIQLRGTAIQFIFSHTNYSSMPMSEFEFGGALPITTIPVRIPRPTSTNLGRDGQMDGRGLTHWSAYSCLSGSGRPVPTEGLNAVTRTWQNQYLK